MAVTLRYFTEFGKPALQEKICGGIYANVYCIFYCVYNVVVKKFTFAISSPDEFLVIFDDNKTDIHSLLTAVLRVIRLAAVIARRLPRAEFFFVNTLSTVTPHKALRTLTTSCIQQKHAGLHKLILFMFSQLHFVPKRYSNRNVRINSTSRPTRPTQPFILPGSINEQ